MTLVFVQSRNSSQVLCQFFNSLCQQHYLVLHVVCILWSTKCKVQVPFCITNGSTKGKNWSNSFKEVLSFQRKTSFRNKFLQPLLRSDELFCSEQYRKKFTSKKFALEENCLKYEAFSSSTIHRLKIFLKQNKKYARLILGFWCSVTIR